VSKTPPKNTCHDWHPADVKAALEKAGWTLASLARHHGLSSASPMSHTLGFRTYPINEKRIADALGMKPQHIWPSRYNADGTAKGRGVRGLPSRHKSSETNCQRNGKSKAAA